MTDFDDDTWLLLVNPISGSGRGVRDRARIEAALAAHGQRHIAATSEHPGHAIELVSEAIVHGCRRVLVAGGDGSLSEAVNGIFNQRSVAPEAVLLALLPIGTGNDWARGPGLARDYDGALRAIAAGVASEKDRQRRHDVGVIEFPATGKSRYCGGGMLVAPRARPDDGLLDLTLIRHMSRWRVLASLPRLFDGSLERHPKVSVWRSGCVIIAAPTGAAIEADGELVGHAPATLTVLRQALRIVAPPAGSSAPLTDESRSLPALSDPSAAGAGRAYYG